MVEHLKGITVTKVDTEVKLAMEEEVIIKTMEVMGIRADMHMVDSRPEAKAVLKVVVPPALLLCAAVACAIC